MNQSDAYYRGFLAYLQTLSDRSDCLRDRRTLTEGEGTGEIRVKRVLCEVDESWIIAIENGLVHIEKAIREDRQFIYSNGEVVPIERVKHVSKDSVEHLARHADLISRAEEGEDIVPDKLYTVERLSDYAVYENRFLYMLLCYLRDFVTLRYRRINELTNRYEGTLIWERNPEMGGRELSLSIRLREVREDDPYVRTHNTARGMLDRMDLILKTIASFLATPLMESAGKAAMLRPPLTKTNVLKMDNNFKGALALYEYVIAYEGDGYTVTEEEQTLLPSMENGGGDLSEVGLLLSHLTRRYALDMTAELEAARAHDEALERLAELQAREERLATMGRRLENGTVTPAYLLSLEEQLRAWEQEADRQISLQNALYEERMEVVRTRDEVKALARRVERFDEEQREADVRRMEAGQAYEAELTAAMAEERQRLALRFEEVQTLHNRELEALRASLAEEQTKLAHMETLYRELTEEKRLMQARALGQRALDKDVTAADMEAMTDKESCDELERQLEAFVELYGKVWKKTKRKIRKELLNPKYIKGQKGRR